MTVDTEAFLRELAAIAAAEILPHFRNLDAIENKDSTGFDPVTLADRNAERAIRKAISIRHPKHGIVGEEFGNQNPDADTCWVIDPIDGTKSFIAGIPLWGTLIGLCEHAKPVAGIMSQPFTGETFLARAGKSVFEYQGKSTALKTSNTEDLEEAIIMSTSPDLFSPQESARFDELTVRARMVRYGADCYAYCMLAAGQIDLVVEAGLKFHDVAALIPIIENAGGLVTDWQGKPFGNTGQILAAANPTLHRKALIMLA